MPPKKGDTSKKSQEKKANKIVEDKTFGLKNKNKSKSVQKYIAGVNSQVKGQNKVLKSLRWSIQKAEAMNADKKVLR